MMGRNGREGDRYHSSRSRCVIVSSERIPRETAKGYLLVPEGVSLLTDDGAVSGAEVISQCVQSSCRSGISS
jgi:hypothetical protein